VTDLRPTIEQTDATSQSINSMSTARIVSLLGSFDLTGMTVCLRFAVSRRKLGIGGYSRIKEELSKSSLHGCTASTIFIQGVGQGSDPFRPSKIPCPNF